MVTGGISSGQISLDSTEIFSDNIWKTVYAKLYSTLYDLRVATIDNRVLAFGK